MKAAAVLPSDCILAQCYRNVNIFSANCEKKYYVYNHRKKE